MMVPDGCQNDPEPICCSGLFRIVKILRVDNIQRSHCQHGRFAIERMGETKQHGSGILWMEVRQG